MNVFDAIKSRRSIREFKPDSVDEEKLRAVLEAARWAPSWANTQCWDLVVVKDPATKLELSETLPPSNPSTNAVKNAPVVIVACARLGKSGYKKGVVTTDKGDFFMFDTALALSNLSLAAVALGLGTVHVGNFDAKKAAQILCVPEGACVVEMMPLGQPAQSPTAPARRECTEFVHLDKYGQKQSSEPSEEASKT